MSNAARSVSRGDFDTVVRLRLLEDDADTIEGGFSELREELSGMRKLLVGILVSVTTASILLVVNVIVIGAK